MLKQNQELTQELIKQQCSIASKLVSSFTNFDNAVTKDSIKYIDKVGELYAIALETLISFMMNELYTQQYK